MIDESLRIKLVKIAKQQITAGVNFKKPRIKQIQKFEDMYANKVAKSLKNRFNIPLPILSGFVDTLKSKIDDAPIINYGHVDEADIKVARKVSAAWVKDSGEDRGRWGFIDRLVKTNAIFSGRGIYKIFSESDPIYKSNLEVRDYYDFYCEPQGGPDLEKHLFLGEQNIFKTKKSLIDGANSGFYDKVGVGRLMSHAAGLNETKNQKDFDQKINRARSLGLDPNSNNYIGSALFNLTEHYLDYDGKRYYLLFDEITEICARADELARSGKGGLFMKDPQTGDALYPYVSWATHEDNYNFWSKGPCDDIYPIAEAMRIIFNNALDNLYKRTWGQRAFDSKVFPDPSKLEWRPDGLVEANNNGQGIQNGIYEFKTSDNTTITLNLMNFVDNFMGQKSGIPAGAQGASDKDKKVGIFFGEMEQVSDRLGLTNKIYKEGWAQLGKRYMYGLKDNLNEKMAVKIFGSKGIEWDELDKNEITDLNITVSGGNDEAKFNEMKNQKKIAALNDISSNPNIAAKINPDWLIEQKLKAAGYEVEEIQRALDIKNFGEEDLMSEAAKAIQDIVDGKTPKKNNGATSGFLQKIVDFAYNNEVKMDVFDRLLDYANAHMEIAAENMARKAQSIVRERNMAAPAEAPMPGQPGQPGMPSMPGQPSAPINPLVQAKNDTTSMAKRSAMSSQGINL